MQVSLRTESGRFTMLLDPAVDDVRTIARSERSNYHHRRDEFSLYGADERYSLKELRVTFEHPDFSPSWRVHPDIGGLIAVLVALPFSRKEILLSEGVSPQFAATVKELTDRTVGPVDHGCRPRQMPRNGRAGVLFSGGTDSFAASVLVPDTAKLFYLERAVIGFEAKLGNYSADAAKNACAAMRRAGRDVYRVQSDLELLLEPASLPTHQAVSIPALLFADECGLDCLAFGTVLEPTFGVHRGRFKPIAPESSFNRIRKLYEAVGLLYNPITMVLSEIGTSTLVQRMELADYAVSCPRAHGGEPCMLCVKCFRKSLIRSALKGSVVEENAVNRFAKSPMIQRALRKKPVPFNNIYQWVFSRAQLSSEFMATLSRWFAADACELEWMERYYAEAAEHLPEKYYTYARGILDRHFEPMSRRDVSALMSVGRRDRSDEEYADFHNALDRFWPGR